jgi:hypothetical protein
MLSASLSPCLVKLTTCFRPSDTGPAPLAFSSLKHPSSGPRTNNPHRHPPKSVRDIVSILRGGWWSNKVIHNRLYISLSIVDLWAVALGAIDCRSNQVRGKVLAPVDRNGYRRLVRTMNDINVQPLRTLWILHERSINTL